jgi:hypothetical protein
MDLTDHDDEGGDGLKDQGETPRPIAFDFRSAEDDSSCQNAATEPTAWYSATLMIYGSVEGADPQL